MGSRAAAGTPRGGGGRRTGRARVATSALPDPTNEGLAQEARLIAARDAAFERTVGHDCGAIRSAGGGAAGGDGDGRQLKILILSISVNRYLVRVSIE